MVQNLVNNGVVNREAVLDSRVEIRLGAISRAHTLFCTQLDAGHDRREQRMPHENRNLIP